MENSRHLERVQSREGRLVLEHFISKANALSYEMRCSDKSFVPHIQFRKTPGQRPYPFALSLNRDVPTFYVRRPTAQQRDQLFANYEKVEEVQGGEVKIRVADVATARRLAAEFL